MGTQILGFALGVMHILAFKDANMLVSPKPIFNCDAETVDLGRRVGQYPNVSVFMSQWNIGFSFPILSLTRFQDVRG